MAKDDYFLVACKILTYYYACLQGDTVFSEATLERLADRRDIPEQYWWYILRNLTEEGYLSGIAFTKAWGNIFIPSDDLENGQITPAGIAYLHDNSTMAKAKNLILSTASPAADLIRLVIGA